MGTNITGVAVDAYSAYASVSQKTGKTDTTSEAKTGTTASETGVVYEKSETVTKKSTYSVTQMSAEDRAALVEQLKADQENNKQSLSNIVQEMLSKQANATNLASLFSSENLANISAEDIAKAKEDVSEDGYYGVKQTSQRLFDFASALAGDDVDKMKEMEEAMMKGFEEATKAWGEDLPDLCQQTIDAAKQLFADYYASKEA